eukprot:4406174-Amphidinium_carterae.1
MQSGSETRRYRATGRHGPKACSLLHIQTLGEHRASAQRGEGSGDPFSAATSRCPQEEASGSGRQGTSFAGQACEAQGASPQVDLYAGQAAGAACGSAGQGPATPKRAGYDPYRVGKAPGG